MARRKGGVNAAFLQGDDPEADLMGKAAAAAPAPPAPRAVSTTTPPATVASSPTARLRGRSQTAGRAAQRPPAPPQRPEQRWQRVNVYLEPRTQGHWLNRTRGRLLEQDRRDIGVTEIVRLALDRLSEQLNVSELVAEYDRRYAAQEDT